MLANLPLSAAKYLGERILGEPKLKQKREGRKEGEKKGEKGDKEATFRGFRGGKPPENGPISSGEP